MTFKGLHAFLLTSAIALLWLPEQDAHSQDRRNPFQGRSPLPAPIGQDLRSNGAESGADATSGSYGSTSSADPLSRSQWIGREVFGTVDPKEFTTQPDHAFPYEVLFTDRRIHFQEQSDAIVAVMQQHVRIRILGDEPQSLLDASLVTIPVRRDPDLESVSRIEGKTSHPDGSYTLLSDRDIRRVQYNAQIDLIEFILPDVKKGAIIEYRYTRSRKVIEELPEFRFSDRVPVRRASLHIVHQPWIRYQERLNDPGDVVRFLPERIDTATVQRVFSLQGPEPVFIAHWIAQDIPPEEFVYEALPSEGAATQIQLMLGEFGLPRQPLDNTWEFVDARLRRISDPFALARQAPALWAIGDSLASVHGRGDGGATDAQAIMHGAVRRLQEASAPGSIPSILPVDGRLDGVLAHATSDQATLNLALMAILRGAGLDARPVYHSDRGFGRLDTLFPTLNQFQRVLVAVVPQGSSSGASAPDGTPVFLDASFQPGIPGLVPPESAGQLGFMAHPGGGFDWVEISGVYSRYGSDLRFEGRLTVEGAVEGRFTARLTGYSARAARLALQKAEDPSEYLTSVFFDRYATVDVGQVDVLDTFAENATLVISSQVLLEGYAVRFTDGLDLVPLIVGYLQEHPFQAEARKTPLQMDAPERLAVNVRLDLPGRVRQPSIPSPVREARVEGVTLTETYSTTGSSLTYSLLLDRASTTFSVDTYPALRQVYERWVDRSTTPWRLGWK